MKKRKLSLLCFSLILTVCSFAQERFTRQVIIKPDTTYDINNLRYESDVIEPYVMDGMIIYVTDNPFRVSLISEMKNNYSNGIHLLFYNNSGMPREKGMLVNGKEDGEWFYWSEKGKLIKKEIWRKGKLLKRIKIK